MHNVYLLLSLFSKRAVSDTRRVGHGIGIVFTPELMKKYKDEGIGFEVCPISNQVLAYYKDLTVHPLKIMIRNKLRVALCNDDPGLFRYNDMTPDY
mmetsp:Transcript_99617/g.214967  ORF Transcript_99617/g.214967 Transcript_99617/m.214967 type:complete len:96 (+) Transcript_99617:2108-2395(+)